MRIGELFAGYGGLGLGVQAVLGGQVAWYSEIDKGALKILEHRFPGVPNVGDVLRVDWSQVEPVDVLVGGFPCQDISSAGKRAGLIRGTRSGLWHEYVRAIKELQPGLVVIENVRGIYTTRGDITEEYDRADQRVALVYHLQAWVKDRIAHARNEGRRADVRRLNERAHRLVGLERRAVAGRQRAERSIVRAIGTVLASLADLGFDAAWHGLRAADIGAPHGRFRVFVIAWPADTTGYAGWVIDRDGAAATDTGGEHGHERRFAAPGQASSGRARGEPSGRGGAPAGLSLLPTPRTQESPPSVERSRERAIERGISLAETVQLLPTPEASDGSGGRVSAEYGGTRDSGAKRAVTLGTAVNHKQDWGRYAPAIARWEAFTRPAPPPTEPGPKGAPRLSPRFVEWMMGLPEGWVTDVPGITRNEALKALGNGVVPQQAAEALHVLLPHIRDAVA